MKNPRTLQEDITIWNERNSAGCEPIDDDQRTTVSVQYLHARDDELTDVNSPQHYDTPAFVSGWPRSAYGSILTAAYPGHVGFYRVDVDARPQVGGCA